MTARWEPLETAEEVVAARDAGRHVERRRVRAFCDDDLYDWVSSPLGRLDGIAALIADGCEYRALIEDSK